MTPHMTSGDVFRAAAELLERDGWTQRTIYDPRTGTRCAYGAILQAAETTEAHEAAYADFLAFLYPDGKPNIDAGIGSWNDQLHMTAETVIEALRAAAGDPVPA